MQNNEIPLWVVASLGKPVALVSSFEGAVRVYGPGSRGVLDSINADGSGGFYATVALDREDPSYLENFTFNQVRPVSSRVSFSLDIERGVMAL